jgi:hypothetical protein
VLVDVDDGPVLTAQLRGAGADDLSIGGEVPLDAESRDEGSDVLTVRPVEA